VKAGLVDSCIACSFSFHACLTGQTPHQANVSPVLSKRRRRGSLGTPLLLRTLLSNRPTFRCDFSPLFTNSNSQDVGHSPVSESLIRFTRSFRLLHPLLPARPTHAFATSRCISSCLAKPCKPRLHPFSFTDDLAQIWRFSIFAGKAITFPSSVPFLESTPSLPETALFTVSLLAEIVIFGLDIIQPFSALLPHRDREVFWGRPPPPPKERPKVCEMRELRPLPAGEAPRIFFSKQFLGAHGPGVALSFFLFNCLLQSISRLSLTRTQAPQRSPRFAFSGRSQGRLPIPLPPSRRSPIFRSLPPPSRLDALPRRNSPSPSL